MTTPDTDAFDYAAFGDEVRTFATEHCPQDIRRTVASGARIGRHEYSSWQKILFRKGWAAPGWPREHGGTGWNPKQRYVFEEVMAQCDCPPQYHHGLAHIGPVIIQFGTAEQQGRFLPGILNGEDWWCQGYSEPGAGSDLASLRTRAERKGGHYVVTGQKVWTSHAHESDLMYTLVRTSQGERKHEGISLLVIPLRLPGVTVRPIHSIDGMRHINEVFLDDVEVPVENRIGDEGNAWGYAKYLLERERVNAAAVPRLERLLLRVADLLEDPAVHASLDAGAHAGLTARLISAEAEVAGVRELAVRAIEDVMHHRSLGSRPSAIKLKYSELIQRVSEIGLDVLGAGGLRLAPLEEAQQGDEAGRLVTWTSGYFLLRGHTIAGGTSEVLRNLIARDLFGH